ncbi:MAG: peptide chain release factor 2 [Deltaproteobacteria bacterium]
MYKELSEMLNSLNERIIHIGSCLDIDGKDKEIAQLTKVSLEENFWSDPQVARDISKKKTRLTGISDNWKKKSKLIGEAILLLDMATSENDEVAMQEVADQIELLTDIVREEELRMMLGAQEDRFGAIIAINAGAGGTEAQDWVEMLLRMYLRWAERKGFKTTVIDMLAGDEAGIKNITITVDGEYAYGYAKAETGIHRLVRISPFDTSGRRHTSFASVFVYPEIDDDITVEINETDLRIDTYRSTGAGGQHVNKTDSAVRITHLPTGIVVQCQNERSQHKNKAMAMKYLQSRLYEMKLEEQREKSKEINKSKKDIGWGSQIRSYVLHPYKMGKDHRTELEIGNTQKVLDGDIDGFIEAYLLSANNNG